MAFPLAYHSSAYGNVADASELGTFYLGNDSLIFAKYIYLLEIYCDRIHLCSYSMVRGNESDIKALAHTV